MKSSTRDALQPMFLKTEKVTLLDRLFVVFNDIKTLSDFRKKVKIKSFE